MLISNCRYVELLVLHQYCELLLIMLTLTSWLISCDVSIWHIAIEHHLHPHHCSHVSVADRRVLVEPCQCEMSRFIAHQHHEPWRSSMCTLWLSTPLRMLLHNHNVFMVHLHLSTNSHTWLDLATGQEVWSQTSVRVTLHCTPSVIKHFDITVQLHGIVISPEDYFLIDGSFYLITTCLYGFFLHSLRKSSSLWIHQSNVHYQ